MCDRAILPSGGTQGDDVALIVGEEAAMRRGAERAPPSVSIAAAAASWRHRAPGRHPLDPPPRPPPAAASVRAAAAPPPVNTAVTRESARVPIARAARGRAARVARAARRGFFLRSISLWLYTTRDLQPRFRSRLHVHSPRVDTQASSSAAHWVASQTRAQLSPHARVFVARASGAAGRRTGRQAPCAKESWLARKRIHSGHLAVTFGC